MRKAFLSLNSSDKETISAKNSVAGTKYEGFMCLRGEGEEREAERNIPNDILASLVNSEGLIYIGDSAIHYTYDHKISIANPDGKSKQEILKIDSSSLSKDVKVSKIFRKIIRISNVATSNPNARIAVGSNEYRQTIDEYWHGGALCCKKRMVSEISATGSNPAYFNYLSTSTKHQKRTSGIWYGENVPVLAIDWSIAKIKDYNNNLISEFSIGNRQLYNADGFSLQIPTGNVTQFTIISWFSKHSAICADGQKRQRDLYW